MTAHFHCPYLNAQVALTDEREQHIAERHPDLLPEHRQRIADTLTAPDQGTAAYVSPAPGCSPAGSSPFVVVNTLLWSSLANPPPAADTGSSRRILPES